MAARAVRRGLLAVTLATGAAGFDVEAHDAIGQACASAMDQQAVKQVKRLLGGQDASDVAGWGHQVDDTFPGMARLHFQVHDDANNNFCGAAASRIAKCQDNICLLEAVKHFYGKVLADEGRKVEYPQIDYRKVAEGIKFTDADAVKLLINLIGDMHQPLHVGFAGDDNGRNIQVKFRGQIMSLYDVWDKGLSEVIRNTESNFWLGGWTHVRAVGAEFQRDTELWKKDGPMKSFDRWLSESVDFACNKVYTHPTTNKRLAGPGAEAQPIEIDDAAFMVWRNQWLQQLLIAGERTAIVLNDILDASSASKLHQGSGVKTKADLEKEKQKAEWAKEREKHKKEHPHKRKPLIDANALIINLMIAAVVVPVFLLVANYGPNPNAYAELFRSFLENNSKTGGASPTPGGRNNAKRWE